MVAVTGAAGFIGRNLVGLLEEDDSVTRIVAVDLSLPRTAGAKTRFYNLDLTQPAVDARLSEILHADEVDTVVHLAFLSAPTRATAWSHELESVGTMHVLNACREKGVGKFVLWSQTLLYGPHPGNPNFLTEDHPLRGMPGSSFVHDKIEAEREVGRFAESAPQTTVTVLRLAPILGPTIDNWVSRWLSKRLVPTAMGFDPLVQFVHEIDAVAAFRLAIDQEAAGPFNIVGSGVLPISTVLKLAGKVAVPLPYGLARRGAGLLWASHLSDTPGALVDCLRYLCVADGTRAGEDLGFRPAYGTREAVLDFEGALRMREARLLQEVRG